MSAELAGFDRKPPITKSIGEQIDQDAGGFRIRRGAEAGPATLARVALEGELTHDQAGSADLENGSIELAGFVGENPQFGGFGGEPIDLGRRV